MSGASPVPVKIASSVDYRIIQHTIDFEDKTISFLSPRRKYNNL